MTRKSTSKLKDEHRAFVVVRLACYDTPKEAAETLRQEYGIEIAPQSAEAYDPTKRAGRNLAKKWVELFESTRSAFLENAQTYVPIANKTVRLREMQKAFLAHKGRGNWVGAMQVLEQAAKEMGNVHTNRREFTGRDGKPMEVDLAVSDMTDEQVDARLLELLAQAAGRSKAKDAVADA